MRTRSRRCSSVRTLFLRGTCQFWQSGSTSRCEGFEEVDCEVPRVFDEGLEIGGMCSAKRIKVRPVTFDSSRAIVRGQLLGN